MAKRRLPWPATHGTVRGGPLFRNWGNRDDQGIDPPNKPKILLMDVSVVSVVAEAWLPLRCYCHLDELLRRPLQARFEHERSETQDVSNMH